MRRRQVEHDDPGDPARDDGADHTSGNTDHSRDRAHEIPEGAEGAAFAGEPIPNKKPKVTVPQGPPPKKLVVQDLIVGKGKRAKNGPAVGVQYVGVLYNNGKEFDSSWKGNRRRNTFGFALGLGQVIAGWDQGIPGMKEGGRRRLIIPARLAYGKQGLPPKIPPNSALVFDVDLVKAY